MLIGLLLATRLKEAKLLVGDSPINDQADG